MIVADSLGFTHTNGLPKPTTFWFEPICDEIVVPPGSIITVHLKGEPTGTLEIDEDGDFVTIWSPAGALLEIEVDGIAIDCGSSKIPVPDLGPLTSKGFVNLVFGEHPEARPGGKPRPKVSILDRIKRAIGLG